MKRIRLIIFSLLCASTCLAQFPWSMHAAPDDPVYTTYAATIERTDYTIDHGYHLVYNDPSSGPVFRSSGAGTIGLAYNDGISFRFSISMYYEKPHLTLSYPDAVCITSKPFDDIRVDQLFIVYSSGDALMDVSIENTGKYDRLIEVYPFIDLAGTDHSQVSITGEGFRFTHHKERDGWMKQHDIPLAEDYDNIFAMRPEAGDPATTSSPDGIEGGSNTPTGETLYFNKKMMVPADGSVSFRVIRSIRAMSGSFNPRQNIAELEAIDEKPILEKDEALFQSVPRISFSNPAHQAVYYNAFSMMRQCMMPPEGNCGYNYYVFSREPKWGWGYGGQVFHESLAMLAYAYMDPTSAMNSQRVYIERQRDDGYINYRTGPYLDENIYYEGEFTSSAPWYNYQNYQVYLITRDVRFLAEAYVSGKDFYNYYTSHRDKDNDGLCEWGGHAVLESVRDARVAAWDKVGWPSNFEGPDINSMLVMEARSLARMAEELGLMKEAREWDSDADRRSALINDFMWDPETGFYYNIDMNDHDFSYKEQNDLKIMEIIGFLPLWAGVASEDQAERLSEHLFDKERFWRSNGIPTLSADDPYYNPMGYWNGPVWVEWNYLIFKGLLDYGYHDEAKELTHRLAGHLAHHLTTSHDFYEFYSPDDSQAGYHSTYIWTGLMARFFIDLEEVDSRQ